MLLFPLSFVKQCNAPDYITTETFICYLLHVLRLITSYEILTIEVNQCLHTIYNLYLDPSNSFIQQLSVK